MYTLLIVLIYLAFVSLGLPDSLLGAAWPVMHVSMGVPVSYMGIVSFVISGCTIVSSLMSDRLTGRFGTARVTVSSVFLTAVALFGFSFSDRFVFLILFALPYGLGAGAIDAALNNYVALHYSSRHMSWLHCFWGVGTIAGPFVMRYALTHAVWNTGYRIIAAAQCLIGLVLLFTMRVWNVHGDEGRAGGRSAGIAAAMKIKGVPVILVAFLCYCAAEATVISWASTYLVEVRGVTVERAAGFAALFYIGITAGRFLSGLVSNRIGDRRMIISGTVIMFAALILMFLPSDRTAFAALLIFGIGCAPVYPSIIHSTPDNFGKENSGAVVGMQMAGAYAGSTLMPPLFGLAGGAVGFGILPFYLAFFTVLTLVMSETAFRICGRVRR